MRRLTLAIVTIVIFLAALGGCSTKQDHGEAIENNRFEIVYEYIRSGSNGQVIIKDTKTGVLYLQSFQYGKSGVTVLYNADGSIMTEGEE